MTSLSRSSSRSSQDNFLTTDRPTEVDSPLGSRNHEAYPASSSSSNRLPSLASLTSRGTQSSLASLQSSDALSAMAGHAAVATQFSPMENANTGEYQLAQMGDPVNTEQWYQGAALVLANALEGSASTIASGISLLSIYAPSTALMDAMKDGMRLPELKDINTSLQAHQLSMAKTMVKWGITDGLQRNFERLFTSIFDRANIEVDKTQLKFMVAALTIPFSAVLLCPFEKVRHYHHVNRHLDLTLMQSFSELTKWDESGLDIAPLFKGVENTAANMVIPLLSKLTANALSNGDRTKQREIAQKIAMIVTPIRFVHSAITWRQYTDNSGFMEAFQSTLKDTLNAPQNLLANVMLAIALYSIVGNYIYYKTQYGTEDVAAKLRNHVQA